MRIELTINHLPNQKLPLNYHYILSSWIYRTLAEADAEFSEWLHQKGYEINGKKFKHFCFSMLNPVFEQGGRYKIHKKEEVFELVKGPTNLILSFNIDEAVKNMVRQLFQDNMIQLSSGQFNLLGMVEQVKLLPSPTFMETMQYRAMTPICISAGVEGEKYSSYLSPDDERYEEIFIKNLVDKANAYLGEPKYQVDQVKFKARSEKFISKLWKIKGISIRGYLYEFDLTAPKELQEIGYNAGFGTNNSSLGMGFCEVIK